MNVLTIEQSNATTHDAIHHWRAKSAGLRRRQRWHFVHPHARRLCFYGVTSGIWDAACRSTRPEPRSTPEKASN
jgi:hypothetical protein